MIDATHDFSATRDSSGAITYRVTAADGSDTDLATIDGDGLLTASKVGTIKVIVTVAADDDYFSETLEHMLTITTSRDPGLSFTTPVNTLEIGATHDFSAASDSSGAITYRVTAADGSGTDLATIDGDGLLTASKIGMIKVIATVAANDPYGEASEEHDLEITRRSSNLKFGIFDTAFPLSGEPSPSPPPATRTARSPGAVPIVQSPP